MPVPAGAEGEGRPGTRRAVSLDGCRSQAGKNGPTVDRATACHGRGQNLLGSSRKTARGSPINAMATLSLRCVPPLRDLARVLEYDEMPILSMKSSARATPARPPYPLRRA